jgi:UDP-N-acetylglucosamine 2-epimerase (non-hydrolysing)
MAAGHDVVAVDTGQHADAAMSGDVQTLLGLSPQVRCTLPADPDARTGRLHADAARMVRELHPDLVLSLGDTGTVPAYALAARGAGVPFAHLEAGLRSFNQRSVEEVNRRVAAATAALHLAPTEQCRAFLLAEGVESRRIFVVGNPVVDTLLGRGLAPAPVAERLGVLVTAHRPTNVDDPERLVRLVRLIRRLASSVGPVRFPVHPRTTARLEAAGLTGALADHDVRLSGPIAYDELLGELRGSKVTVTDSGGIQEEAAFFGVPVVVLRRSTPRWEGVRAGSTVLAGIDTDEGADHALAAAACLTTPSELARIASLPCPYGSGDTGEQVAALLADPGTDELLELIEPDYTHGQRPW